MLGFNQIAYVFSIVPAIAYTIFAIVAEVTGLPLMSISSFLPFGLILLPIPYYFSSIILAAPGRAVYRITHRDNKNNQTANEDQSEEIDTLRDRYVHGELTEEQFERKLSELLETQIPADTDEWQTNEREKLEE